MIKTDNFINLNPSYSWKDAYSLENILFFDIETTGFSPDVSNVYLIGILHFRENQWKLVQWFADNYQSEKELLCSFFDFITEYRILIHYNGTGFDIPYLLKKCKQHHLSYDFSRIKSLDLYKKIQRLKSILGLPNLKQPTVEKFAGFHRTDPFHGGELIEVYNQYMQKKLLKKPWEDFYDALLLHNREDLLGLFYSTKMLAYTDLLEGLAVLSDFTVSEDMVTFSLSLDNPLPHPLTLRKNGILFQGEDSAFQIMVPFFKGELKFFYKNYKDYYYLPVEDNAIHKSIAAFVDKEFKQKAKASNCYSKMDASFLPQREEIYSPYFQKNYKDADGYFRWTPSVFEDQDTLMKYIKHLLNCFA